MRKGKSKCSRGTLPLAGDQILLPGNIKGLLTLTKLGARILCYPSTEKRVTYCCLRGKAHDLQEGAEKTEEKKRNVQGGLWFQIRRRIPPPLVCGDKPQLSALSSTYGKGAGLSERPLKKKGQSPGSPPDPPGVGGQRSGITACH